MSAKPLSLAAIGYALAILPMRPCGLTLPTPMQPPTLRPLVGSPRKSRRQHGQRLRNHLLSAAR